MTLMKFKVGDLIKKVDEKNIFGITDFYGVNIKKEFMPTSANTKNLDASKYKVIRNNRFVFSGMQTGRDKCIRISMYQNINPVIVSPAYTTFEIKRTDIILPMYFFMIFMSSEKDRLGWFLSDSSVRSNLDWDRFCDIDIELPPIEIQQKYVDIYNALKENQKVYEKGLNDLKFACNAYIDNLDSHFYKPVGKYIERNKKRNHANLFSKNDVKGFNNEGEFIKPMRLFSGDITKFKIISKHDFVYNSRINSTIHKLSVAMNEGNDLIVSPAYESFTIINEKQLYPYYLYMLLQRESFARKVLFNSFGSSTLVFGIDDLNEIELPIPNIEIQKDIANIYKTYKARWTINERLKEMTKKICPILIKGSIEEGRNT